MAENKMDAHRDERNVYGIPFPADDLDGETIAEIIGFKIFLGNNPEELQAEFLDTDVVPNPYISADATRVNFMKKVAVDSPTPTQSSGTYRIYCRVLLTDGRKLVALVEDGELRRLPALLMRDTLP